MADAKISALTALAETPATGDLLVLVDVSDVTDAATGTTKKITRANAVGGLATTALDNLASVAINTALLDDAAAADDFGSATLPWKDYYLAGTSLTPGTNNFKITGASTSGTRVITLPDATGTLLYSGGALGTPSSGTLTNATGLPIAGLTASTVTALGVGSIELGHATDTTIARSGAGAITVEGVAVLLSGGALGTPSSGTLTNCTIPLSGVTDSTSEALGVGSLELGHATDTTLTRVSAGVAAIEGVNILTTAGGTLTGNITLGENTSIALDPAGSADGKYSGITVTGTAGAVLAFGDIVVLDVTDSRWELADANSAAAADGDARGLLGVCVLAAAGDGSATTILLNGIIRADAAFPALTISAPVYLSETAGDVVVAQPTTLDVVIRVLGSALTADEIYFNPSPDYITHT